MTRQLRIGVLTPVLSIDPRQALDIAAAMAVELMYQSPYGSRDQRGASEPLLFEGRVRAESVVKGLSVYSAEIKEGLTFSDGTPVTAEFVAQWYGGNELLSRHMGVEAVGDRLLFSPKHRGFDLEGWLALRSAALALPDGQRLHGTGPFAAAAPPTVDELKLVRNSFSREAGEVDEIVFRAYPLDSDGKPTALLAALRSGEVDITTALSRAEVKDLRLFNRRYEPGGSVALLFMNTTRAPLDELDARLEVARTVEGPAIAADTYEQPMAFLARGLLPPSLYRGSRVALPGLPKQARPLEGKKLRLLTVWAPRPYLPNPERSARLVAGQLEAAGVQTQVVVPETARECLDIVRAGDYDLMLGGWIADGADPGEFLRALFATDAILSPAGEVANCSNISRFSDVKMDAALEGLRLAADKGTALRGVLTIAAANCPVLPLMLGANLTVFSQQIREVPTLPNGSADLARVSFFD
jgi:ABC-type transport system substrate-binding protein